MCVCVNLETYDGEMSWKDGSGRRGGGSPGSCNPWQCSSIRESIGEIMAEVSLIAVKPLATVIEEIV